MSAFSRPQGGLVSLATPSHIHPDVLLPAYFDGLLENSDAVIYVRSVLDGRLMLVNEAFAELVRRPVSDLIGRTTHEIFPAETADAHLATDPRVLAGEGLDTSYETAVDGGGRLHSFVSHKFPVRDTHGQIVAVGGISMDVTALIRRSEELQLAGRDSESRFRAVFDNAPIGQIFSDPLGRITAVNPSMAAILGLPPEQIVGTRTADYADPAEFEKIRQDVQTLSSGAADTINAIRRFRRADGSYVSVRVTSAMLPAENGQPRLWVSIVADLSAEERAQAELERAHSAALSAAGRLQLLGTVATAANDSTDIDGLSPVLMAAVCRHFGWPGAQLIRWGGDGSVHTLGAHGGPAPVVADVPPPTTARVHPAGPRIVVPLAGRDGDRLAWVFDAVEGGYDTDEAFDLLRMVALEASRVSERADARARLAESEQRFRSVFAASPLPMCVNAGDSGLLSAVNPAMCRMLGRDESQLIGLSARNYVHPDDAHLTDPAGAAALADPDGRHRFEIRMLHSSGAVLETVVTLQWLDDGQGGRQLLAQVEDVTARRRAEEMLRRRAERDTLTGLANRTYLIQRLTALAETRSVCAVLFIDLDGFKLINDTRGHDIGDEVLIETARRLSGAVRPSDVLVRFGGDEFVVVCPAADETAATATARLVARRVEAALVEPVATRSGPATVTASVGIASGRVHLTAPQQLLQRADTAMYQAKRLGKDRFQIYDSGLHARSQQQLRTEATLRYALDEGRFVLHYQPIVDLGSRRVIGFEALVRLLDADGALVAPDEFIGVAEQSGLIVPMGRWVLEEACATVADLRARTRRPVKMSVNVAARQAARSDLCATVETAIAAAGLPPSALSLELTESALLEADASTLQQLRELRSRGVGIGLDDFGTGYSSLTYLRSFPVSHLKVDRSFVTGMTGDDSDLAIVRAVTGLAGDLGLPWVAEGIETEAQHRLLSGLGSGLGQGYLYGRPMPREAAVGLMSGARRERL